MNRTLLAFKGLTHPNFSPLGRAKSLQQTLISPSQLFGCPLTPRFAGHSKWSQIKRKKAINDAQRSNIFTKVAREITSAVKQGGSPDPALNFRLVTVMQKAKSVNMPKDNIEAAIKRGSASKEGSNFEHLLYEGYGPAGVAIMVETLTDNRNRTVQHVKTLFVKNGGALSTQGSVAWLFDKKGRIMMSGVSDIDKVMDVATNAGAEDVDSEGDMVEITTAPSAVHGVAQALEAAGFPYESAENVYIAQNRVDVPEDKEESLMKLIDLLEEHEDVLSVHHTANL